MRLIKKIIFLSAFLFTLCFMVPAGVQAGTPANPNASANTRAVLDYFYGLPNRADNRVISGQAMGHSNGVSLSGLTEIDNETGHWLGMAGADYCQYNPGAPASLSDITTKVNPLLINYWNNGGLVTIHLHAYNPQTGSGAWDTTINIDNVLNWSTVTGAKWKTELDTIAAGLQQLEDAGVVVLFRPFHEMNGGWFWWGAKSRFVDLWLQMFNYFTYTKGLNNLLWVYGPNDGTNPLAYYPGDKYVDMTSVDEYGDGVYLEGYKDLITTGKPFGLGEFGPCCATAKDVPGNYDYTKLIQKIRQSYPLTTFFQSWGGPWGIENNLNSSGLLNDSWVANRADLPKFNNISPYCGDSVCKNDENCSSCPLDCGLCSTPVSLPAGPITENIAQGKTVNVSSSQSINVSGANAVDGSTATRWGSQYSDPQDLIIDLGMNYDVSRVALAWEDAAAKNYDIQIGNSKSGPWTTLQSITNNASINSWLDYPNLNGSGRYLRINMKVRFTSWGYSLWEVQVSGVQSASVRHGDLNNDNKVDIFDYTLFSQNFGKTGSNIADLNSDNKVDIFDYTIFSGEFGK